MESKICQFCMMPYDIVLFGNLCPYCDTYIDMYEEDYEEDPNELNFDDD